MNICIIPARGGSKRIPRKNIKPFCGKTMIGYSIEAAIESGCFEKIVVSTDDQDIADLAREFGADVPFMRPVELSDDHTPTRPVINHAINELSLSQGLPEYVCCVYATAPFLRSQDLSDSLQVLQGQQSDFVYSVASFPFPIQRALKKNAGGRLVPFSPEKMLCRSQDLEEAYHDAGQFYWGKTEAFLENRSLHDGSAMPYVLPRYRVQDIDTQEDWIRAEYLYRVLDKTDGQV